MENLEDWATSEFNSLVWLDSQQEGTSRFQSLVMEGDHEGKKASPVNILGTIEFGAAGQRFTPKTYQDPSTERRWVSPQNKDANVLLDRRDEGNTIVDTRPSLIKAGGAATGRLIDNVIVGAFHATAVIGEEGAGTETWDTAQDIAANIGGSTGMNTTKLEAILELFEVNEVDLEAEGGLIVGLTAKQNTNLLREIEVAKSRGDYAAKGALIVGNKVREYLGIKFVHSQRILKSGNDRHCPAWVKSGMHLGWWMRPEWTFTIKDDLTFDPWEMSGKARLGATRTMKKKVGKIICTE